MTHPKQTPRQLMETYLTEVIANGRLEVIANGRLEVIANGRLELIAELAQPDLVDEANQVFGGPPGRDGLTSHVKGFRRHIGALKVNIDQVIAGNDEVMTQWSFTGIHVGPCLSRTATRREISGTVFSFFPLEDGRISHYRVWLHAMLDEPVVFDSSNPVLTNN
ncbi:ester cyclase [bacterium]|nr:ester cyclase [bacterium]